MSPVEKSTCVCISFSLAFLWTKSPTCPYFDTSGSRDSLNVRTLNSLFAVIVVMVNVKCRCSVLFHQDEYLRKIAQEIRQSSLPRVLLKPESIQPLITRQLNPERPLLEFEPTVQIPLHCQLYLVRFAHVSFQLDICIGYIGFLMEIKF